MNLFGNVNTMFVRYSGGQRNKPDKNHNSNIIVIKYIVNMLLLLFLRINVDLAIFQPYLDLEAGDTNL